MGICGGRLRGGPSVLCMAARLRGPAPPLGLSLIHILSKELKIPVAADIWVPILA